MKVRIVTSLREFDELAGLWDDVTTTSGQHSALLSHDWFACCWRTAGANRARELWIVEDSAGPLALVPLVRARTRYRGLPARVLQLMHPPETPMADFPVAREHDEVVDTLLEQLAARDDWDVFLVPGLPTHSPILKAFDSAAPGRFRQRIADRASVPYLTLSDRDAVFRLVRDTVREHAAAARAQPGVAISVEEHRELNPRGQLFEEIMGIVRNGFRSAGTLPPLTANDVRRFFRELTPRASARKWLSLWVLRLDGRVVETEYQLVSPGTVHALRVDSDQSPRRLRLRDVLTSTILDRLARRPGLRTYFPAPGIDITGLGEACPHYESVFVELFAAGSYGHLLHQVESRVAALARRLGLQRGRSCA